MTNNMQFHTTEVTENIKLNKASSSLSTYYLLLHKIKTMIVKMEPKKVTSVYYFSFFVSKIMNFRILNFKRKK